jgi:threonine dehydrogenase-like Zn-dependent dehydrogenase
VSDTCRAVVFGGDGTHEIREFAIPAPPDGGAVLRVEAVGLCGSDVAQHAGVHLIPGTSAFPVVPGHETVGRVWRLGRDAALGVSEGDRVAVDEVLSQQPPLAVYGYTMPVDGDGGGLFGGYGEYMVVLPGTRLHRLRDDKPAAELTVFEPMANAVNWVEIAGVRPGQTVVIEGPGHQGLAVLEAVLAAGADTVIVTGAAGDGLRLDTARAIGAHEVIDVSATDATARVRDLTGGRMADVVMDVSPAVDTVPLALDLVAFRGTVLLAGLKHFAPVDGIVTDKIVVQGLRVLGGSGYTPESMAKAVDLINTGAIDVGHLRGDVFGLDEIDEALGLLARTIPGRDAVRVSLAHQTRGI